LIQALRSLIEVASVSKKLGESGADMTSDSEDLEEALRENLKLRGELESKDG